MRMKKILFLVAFATLCSASQMTVAQDRVKEIRKMYADALEQIKMQKEEPRAVSLTEVKSKANYGGVGLVEETISFYSTPFAIAQLESADDVFSPFFIRTKKDFKEASVGASMREYVFDTNTGNLTFCFVKSFGYEGDMDLYEEQRLYFNGDGSLCTSNAVVKKKSDNSQVTTFVANEEEALKESRRLKELFNSMMNECTVKQIETPIAGSPDLTFFGLIGPVKRVKQGESDELIFDRNGRLVLCNGMDPFRASGPSRSMSEDGSFYDNGWMRRNAQGMICGEYFFEMARDYEIGADGRILKEMGFYEDQGGITTYNYDIQGRLVSIVEQTVEYDQGSDPLTYSTVGDPETTTFTYLEVDSHGNWTKRQTQDGDVMSRVIEYYF